MILTTVITNLTRNLDVICQQGGKGISSHEKPKDEALKCLLNIIENAPDSEYNSLILSESHEVLLGYLLSIMCQLAKDDRSRLVRQQSLSIIDSLVKRLDLIHQRHKDPNDTCSITTLVLALPGVSSALFKLSMSDTKLPKALLVKTLRTLANFISVSFSSCDHIVKSHLLEDTDSKLDGQNLIDTCDNLAPRIGYLIDYVTSNCDDLHDLVKLETLDLCNTMVKDTRIELLTRTLKPIVKYIAFTSSSLKRSEDGREEAKLKLMLLIDNLRQRIQESSGQEDSLDSMALDCMFKILDELEENCLSMLVSERQAKLAMLCGLLELLPQEVMMTFLEAPQRKEQFFTILSKLVEFSTQQPFLFLTDSRVSPGALERRGERIYTIEKRFAHLTDKEIAYINTCCETLGCTSDWHFLCDELKCDFMRFDSANNLYLTLQILRGCLRRDVDKVPNISRLTSQLLNSYTEIIQAHCVEINAETTEEVYSDHILRTVLAIETVAVIVQMHVRFTANHDRRIVILMHLLCPMLHWCSSSSRAVSEAALNAFTQIGQLYGHETNKTFIEEFTDYIVNGAAIMLESFLLNSEVLDVLAITFKLSSMDTFYYFKDIYEKIFKVLAKYHHTEKSRSIALFFLRTLTILNEWQDAKRDNVEKCAADDPLKPSSNLKTVIDSLNIDKRIARLKQEIDDTAKLMKQLEHVETQDESEQEIKRQIETGEMDLEQVNDEVPVSDQEDSKKKKKPEEVALTERILKHCIGLMSSDHMETKTLALKAAACGLRLLRDDEDTLLPIVHQIWPPLLSRLTEEYSRNLEVNLCAFECLISMAIYSGDFIKRRTLDAIVPRLCLFLEAQAALSSGKRDYGPYCMTMAYKCQLKILAHMGQLAYHTEIAYGSLWRIVEATLRYLDKAQVPSLREAALNSLRHLIALDADCVWYFAKHGGQLQALPFQLVYETF